MIFCDWDDFYDFCEGIMGKRGAMGKRVAKRAMGIMGIYGDLDDYYDFCEGIMGIVGTLESI